MQKLSSILHLLFMPLWLSSAQAQTSVVWENTNLGAIEITQPGIYQIKGTVIADIQINVNSGNVILEGIGDDATYFGYDRNDGSQRSVSHIRGKLGKDATLLIRNLLLKGNGHNMIGMYGDGYREIRNCHVINYQRTENGFEYPEVGGINYGRNSLITDCMIEPGDDGVKLTEHSSKCSHTKIIMRKNGSAIQLGWENQFEGAMHVADDIMIKGQVIPNIQYQDAWSMNSGRCIIGGIIENDGSNVHLTNLDIDVTQYKHLIKLYAHNIGNNPVLSDVLIQGKITDSSVMNETDAMRCVNITADAGARIENMVIDLGDKIANPIYHTILGDVNVKFLKTDGSTVEYLHGQLQSSDIKPKSKSNAMTLEPLSGVDGFMIRSDSPIRKIEMFDMSGKCLPVQVSLHSESSELKMLHQTKGVYLVKVTTSDFVHTFKYINR